METARVRANLVFPPCQASEFNRVRVVPTGASALRAESAGQVVKEENGAPRTEASLLRHYGVLFELAALAVRAEATSHG